MSLKYEPSPDPIHISMLQVATEERLASLTGAFSYDVPVVTAATTGNARTLGGVATTVLGGGNPRPLTPNP